MSAGERDLEALATAALTLEKWPLARLVRLCEDPRPAGIGPRRAVLEHLDALGAVPRAAVLGITGTPGTGKSTLVGALAARLVQQAEVSVAVLAVDPSSHRSGGSLLGDRTRVQFPTGERRLYFRSQAAGRELGGLAPATYPVVRVLERLFDYLFIETVGVGQSEIAIAELADRVYLVLQPLAGDQIQFMKAGIMEVPDVFVLNKCDTGEVARRSFYALRASIDFARPGEGRPPPILRTSAVTGEGIDELLRDIASARTRRHDRRQRERHFLERWVREEYGRLGLELLACQGGAATLLEEGGSFEAAQAAYIPPVARDQNDDPRRPGRTPALTVDRASGAGKPDRS